MALSGDQCSGIPSIRLDKDILISNSGLISEDQRDHWVKGAVEVVNGEINQVLPLIGYQDHDIHDLLDGDGVMSSTDETVDRLKQFGQRSPGSFLLVHSNRVYGVVVDHQNECRVIGQINAVIPFKENKDMNVVIVSKDGTRRPCNSKSFDLKQMVSSGIVFGIVSEGGFAFIETDINDSLVLVANKGYFIFEESKVNWMRLEVGLRKDQFAVKVTTILPNEVIVSRSGAYIRDEDRYVVYGSHNAVVNFTAFQNFLNAMGTVGYESNELEKQKKPSEPTDLESSPNVKPELDSIQAVATDESSIEESVDSVS